jgi:glycosyltransferase involved in cell wall biosynthesis
VTGLKFSIVIPYKQRLHNLTTVLASLADQTMPGSQFEVLVGAMEYSPGYVRLCRDFAGRLDIVSVLTSREWNVSRARNLAMRHATGQVTVLLDADIALPPDCLRGLFGRYFAAGQDVCVLGKLAGYSEVDGGNVEPGEFEALPYSHYRAILAGLAAGGREITDPRWDLDQVPLPWTLVWTALVALPTSTIARHGLGFDERFCGWGPEDQEWGYRIHMAGTPIVRGDGVYGLHLPHVRDAAANWRTDRDNSRYFLAKWPCLEVELSRAFGWRVANQEYPGIKCELAGAGDGRPLGIARGTVAGRDVLLAGVPLDSRGRICQAGAGPLFDGGQPAQTLPLAGFAVPYHDKSVAECRVLPPIARLSARYRDAVLAEAKRVACRVAPPRQQPHPAARG